MKNIFNKNNKATIGGYIVAIFNGLVVLDIDTMNWHLPSSYFKILGAIILPIVSGHISEIKGSDEQSQK